MKYESLKVFMKGQKLYFNGNEIESYIDLINSYTENGYKLFQILALPIAEEGYQLSLDIILQKDTDTTYKQGFPF